MAMSATSAMPATASMLSSGSTMAFNTNNLGSVLYSTSWMPVTTAGYVGTWFFLFVLAVVWRGLVVYLASLDAFWVRKHENHAILINGGQEKATRRNTVQAWRLSVNLPRAALAMLIQGIAYLLYARDCCSPQDPRLTVHRMIAVMTMNVGFFFAVVVGFFFGELAFARVGRGVT